MLRYFRRLVNAIPIGLKWGKLTKAIRNGVELNANLLERAILNETIDKYEDAIVDLKNRIDLFGYSLEASELLSRNYFRLRDYANAADWAEKSILKGSEDKQTLSILNASLCFQEKTEKAIGVMHRIELTHETLRQYARICLGHCHYDLLDYGEALTYYNSVEKSQYLDSDLKLFEDCLLSYEKQLGKK